MQTFLPYPDFKDSLQVLDYRRLGKQRVEAYQIINILEDPSPTGSWINHPAVLMWRDNVEALKQYCNIAIQTWIARGFKNNMALYKVSSSPILPWWFGLPEFHISHQSNLIRKLPDRYGPIFLGVPSDIPYWWPTQHENLISQP